MAIPLGLSPVVALPAAAQSETGNTLYSECTKGSSDIAGLVDNARCLGFIEGVQQEYENYRMNTKLGFCLPEGVTFRQMQDVVIQYL